MRQITQSGHFAILFDGCDWMRDAACQSYETRSDFFPEHRWNDRSGKLAQARALAVCEQCLVTEECLSYAIKTRAVGIWGGTTADQRTQLVKAGAR